MKEFIKTLKDYISFNGRTTRKDYWLFILFNTTVVLSLMLLPMLKIQILVSMCIWCLFFYTIIITIPAISISIRRLHDIGKSGLWYFINFVPCIGLIVFIAFMLRKGDIGPNEYDRIPCPSYKRRKSYND